MPVTTHRAGGTGDSSTSSRRPRSPQLRRLAPGLLLAAAGATVAMLLGSVIGVLSALTAAVVLGIATGNSGADLHTVQPGLQVATRALLRAGVVLLGLQLAIGDVLALGPVTVLVVVACVGGCFAATLLFGRLLRVPRGLTVLVATGFSICGASAIAAMEGVVRRRDEDVATAIALVTLYGTLAIAAIPLVATSTGLAGADAGMLAGLSVHEVGQVVAAASPAGAAAVAAATVLKLSRVVLLAPMVAGVSLVERAATRTTATSNPPSPVPLFVLGFLAMVALRSTGLLPDGVLNAADTATTVLLAGALFGLGCAVRIRAVLRSGPRALILGALSTLVIAAMGLAAVHWVI